MKVRPGPDGLQAFLRQLEVIVGRDVAHVNFVFRCRCPDTGAEIFLQVGAADGVCGGRKSC